MTPRTTPLRLSHLAALALTLLLWLGAPGVSEHPTTAFGQSLDTPPPDSAVVWPIRFSGLMPQGFVDRLRTEIRDTTARKSERPAFFLETAWERFVPRAIPMPLCAAGDDLCVLKAGKSLLIRHHIISTLQPGGEGWILDLRLIDVARRQVIGTSRAEFDGTPETVPGVMSAALDALRVRNPVPIPKRAPKAPATPSAPSPSEKAEETGSPSAP